MDTPLISVIMSVYNEREEWLRSAIESILNQTYPHIEFIILLDAPDNTLLEGVILEYAAADSRVKFLKNDVNHGLVWSLNRGLEAASGEYIARMDADDVSAPERFALQLRALTERGVDFCGSRFDYMDEDGAYTRTAPHPALTYSRTRRALRHINVIAHPAWFTRADVCKRVGPYHEIPAAEDYEWLCRAAAMGFRLENIEDITVHVRIRSNGISRSNIFRQRLSAHVVSREYRRALRTGRPMREDAILARHERILTRYGEEGMRKCDELWDAGWDRIHRFRILSGACALLRSWLAYPPSLGQFLDQRYFRRLW